MKQLHFNVIRSIRRRARRVLRTSGIFFLTLLTIFYSFGGLDFYLGLMTPFAPREAEAAYTGKHLRTVEFILGGGTEASSRATTLLTYFGSATSTTKGPAGTMPVKIQGSSIEVKSAYIDVAYVIASQTNITNEDVTIDVGGSSSGGTDARVAELVGASLYAQSGAFTSYVRHQYDVTSFFDRQSDASFNAGIPVVASVAVTGPTRSLTTLRLVVTYEQNYSASVHTETKTVRFPLASTAASDRGTRGTVCAAATTCTFLATSTIPDAALDADIVSVYVEMHGEVSSNLSSNWRIGIRGGTGTNATSSPFAWSELLTDAPVYTTIWSPTVGSPNFQRNAVMTFDVLTGTAPVNALGGELVITYSFSTNAAVQTETVRYFMDQRTAGPGTTRNNFATTSMTISNGGLSMKNVWFKVHTAPFAASTFTLFGKVGTSTEVTRGITIAAGNTRAGNDHTIIFDMSDKAGNFFTAATDVMGATQFSAGGAPPGVEAYFTFTWSGSAGGAETKTVTFSAAQQGTNAITGDFNNRPAYLSLPETVTKTYRSAYLETKYMHSQASASFAIGTLTIAVNGSSTVITEVGDTESYASTYFAQIASSTFSDGNTIAWTERAIEISEGKNVANLTSFANMVVVTYDVDFSITQVTPPAKHLRTVEFVLGGGTDTTSRATAVLAYGGATWNTVKGTAGTRSVMIKGSGIAVKNAYLDVSYVINTSAVVTNENVFIDVGGSSSGGTDARVSELLAASLWAASGLSGYQRHQYDVTAFFDRQGDASWNTGIPVATAVSVTGPSHSLTTVRLVITYEENYSLVPHTETKTVRFPLSSMVAGDRGTRSTVCAAATTCSFLATSTIPDAVADGDIVDVYVEIHGEVDSNAASTFQVGIRGGSGGNATSTAYNWTEVLLDDNTKTAIWRPTVGSPNFQRNAVMTFDVLIGAVPMNALGGELVVTYNYSTGAALQTETVRYFMDQNATSTPGNARSEFPTTTMTISNVGLSMQNIWLKAHVAATSTANITIYGKVGTSSEVSHAITIGGVNPRSGDDHNLILDMSDKAGNFYTASTALAGAEQFSAGAAPMAIEVYFTFTWAGNFGGLQTRTATFSATQQGLNALANDYNNRPAYISLPETVTKTYRSAYLETKFMHSQAANISAGNLTIGVNGSSTVIQESADTVNESYASTYFAPIASSTFSDGNTISWTGRVIEINESKSQANLAGFANIVVVTYDANQELLVPTFTQNYFQFYQDNDTITPTVAWPSSSGPIGENAEITAADNPPANGDRVRIRMSLKVATTTMTASSTQFNLQFAQKISTCSAVASWTDLGVPASGALWRGYNATPVSGVQLAGGDPPPGGTVKLSVSDSAGTYQESNPTAVNPFAVIVGNDVEYDWNIQSNNAATNTPYCFRMTKSDDSAFFSYDFYPVITTRGFFPEEKNWRWYDDETVANPTVPLSGAGEGVAPTNVANGNTIKLRLTINEANASIGPNQKFRLQFSTYSDFSANVNYVEATSTCRAISQWCYGDGVDFNNAPVTAPLRLSDSTAGGTHNEDATSTTSFYAPASTAVEYEFTLRGQRAFWNTTYFFRAYDVNHSRAVSLGSGESYPSLSVEGTTLSFSIAGISTSTVIVGEGVTTDITTYPAETRFMSIAPGSTKIAAQTLSVTTNAENGYQVFLGTDGWFMGSGAHVPDIVSTNAVPLDWAAACPGALSGCFGYHAGDDTLLGSTRFVLPDTYAPFASTTLEEVMYNSGPVTADTADMVYRLDIRNAQPAGQYSVRLTYLVVPTF